MNALSPSARLMLADVILVVHLAFVLFVVGGLVLVLLGGLRGWQFVRHPGFRLAHLAAMAVVVAESVWGIDCPLTIWEAQLRISADEPGYAQSFMQHWIQRILFYDCSENTFTILYLLFFAALIGSFWWVPVRWRLRGTDHGPGSA